MSYTLVSEENVLHIRAMISTRGELEALIDKLNRRLETDFAQGEDNANRTSTDAAIPASADSGIIQSISHSGV